MFKNVASQKVTLLAIDTATNLPKTGDAANLTFYVRKDDGAVDALTDTSASEDSATNSPGTYTCDLTQGETDANKLVFSGKSSTADVRVVPMTVYTRPWSAGSPCERHDRRNRRSDGEDREAEQADAPTKTY